jgi:predicted anti-sigma-YlaC factor YlaD
VNESPLERLLRLVGHTQDEELSCSACFELLPQYVDLEIADAAADVRLPTFRQHLEQCRACREEYETLAALARLEIDPEASDENLGA